MTSTRTFNYTMIPFRLTIKRKIIAISIFILLLVMSYILTRNIWGTRFTIIAWLIPVLLNLNNWLSSKINEKKN